MSLRWLLALCFVSVSCDRASNSTPPTEKVASGDATTAATPALEKELVVFGAASLRDVFKELGQSFEARHPGLVVHFQFAGTQELRTQLEQGANADIFASADTKHAAALFEKKWLEPPRVFAKNEPVLITPSQAEHPRDLGELPNATRIVLGVPDVPIGRYTLQILDRAAPLHGADFRARVEAHVVSRELNVRQILTKVSLGEADAGFVYRSDVVARPDGVRVVTLPSSVNVVAEYPIAVVTKAAHPVAARAWISLVFSEEGRAAFEHAGFLPPEAKQP